MRLSHHHTTLAVLIVGIVLMLSLPLIHASGIKVGKNIDVRGETGNDRQVFSPSVVVDPRNPSVIVAAAVDMRVNERANWAGYYRSTDGGASWSSSLLPGFPGDTSPEGLASPLKHNDVAGLPKLAFDRFGNLYSTGVSLNLTASGTPDTSNFEIFVAKFTNDGANYAGTIVVAQGPTFPDFPSIAVDTTGGVNDGNVYLTFAVSFQQAVFTRSLDGGLSFSKPIPIPGGGFVGWGGGLAVDSGENLYVLTCSMAGVCGSGASTKATLLVAKSSDGGLTFPKSVVAASITILPPSGQLRGNSFELGGGSEMMIAADSRGVYIVWDDFRLGESNVLFTRSTDGGLSWGNPVRVNDVLQGQQFYPAIAVSGGIISVAWYDARLGQLSNGTITGLDVFYAESRDAGASFSNNVRVTSVSFNPNLVFFPVFQIDWIGHYVGIAASPNEAHPMWADNRNACDTIDPTFGCVDQDLFTATITP